MATRTKCAGSAQGSARSDIEHVLRSGGCARRFESTLALVDDWYNHAQYCAVFALGFTLARADGFWLALQRYLWTAVAVAIAGYAFVAWYFCASPYGDANPAPDSVRYLQRVMWAANQWATIVAMLGFAYRFRRADCSALRYLVLAVLPVYILHQTVIIGLAHNLKPLQIPPALEEPLLVVSTFALCFAGYEVVRRTRWMRPLFGLKREDARSTWPAPAPSAVN